MSAQDQPAQGQLLIDAKLTQQYRLASPVGGNLIAPLCDQKGVLHVFTLGSDGHVYDVYQDPTSDSGWSQIDTNFNGSGNIVALTAGVEQDGTTIVFTAGSDSKLYYVRDQRFGPGWQNFSTIFSGLEAITALKLCHDNGGQLLLTVSGRFNNNQQPTLYWTDYTQTDTNWGIGNVADPTSDYEWVNRLNDYCVGLDASAGNTNGLSIYVAGNCSDTRDGTVYLPAGKETAWPSSPPPWTNMLPDTYWAWNEPGGFTRIALAPNPNQANDSVLFAIRGADSGLYSVDVATQGLTKLSGSVIQLADIAADLDANVGLSVFGLGLTGGLYNVHQDPNSTNRWTEMVLLDSEMSFLQMRGVKDRSGNFMVFALDSNLDLWQVWRDAATQEWHFAQVEVGTGRLHQYDAYRTQITLLDQWGAAQPSTAVELWSSGITPAMVNGADVGLRPEVATIARTNAAGQILVAIPADGLDTPTLSVHTAFMETSERVAVEPNGEIQARLAAITADQLLNAKDVNGQPLALLAGEFNNADVAGALADSLNQMMAMAGPSGSSSDPALRRHLAPRTKTAVARRISLRDGVAPGRIDLARVPDKHWQLSFKTGVPVFTPLLRAQAVELMAQRRATTPKLGDFDWDVDWGDVWDSVTDTVSEVVDVVVSAVVDPITNLVSEIQAQINLVVGDIKAIFEASIEFVEQVFEMAEGIFAKVKVAWEQLQEWLGFLFSWDDITRTADVLVHLMGVGFDFMEQAVQHVETVIDAKIDEAGTFVQNHMDQFITSFAAGRTIDAVLKTSTAPMPVYEDRVGNNPLLDAFMANYPNAEAGQAPPRSGGAIDPKLQALLDALQTLAASFTKDPQNQQASMIFNEAIGYFQSIPNDPANVVQLSLLGLLKLGESIAIYGLQTLKLLFNLFLEAIAAVIAYVRSVLLDPWYIPIVTDLYEYATGRPFVSLGELFALIIAVPVTAIYKATVGAAPFPDDASVTQVTTTLTAAWLGRRAWGGGPEATEAALPGDADWLNTVRLTLNISHAVNFAGRAFVELAININPQPSGKVLVTANWIQRLLSTLLTTPWILKDTAGPPSQDSPDGWENLTWILQLILGPLRGGILLAANAPGQVHDISLTIWGGIHLVFVSYLAYLQGTYVEDTQLKATENILSCLCPQMLKLLRVPPIPQLTLEFSYPALGLLSLASELEIAVIHVTRTLPAGSTGR